MLWHVFRRIETVLSLETPSSHVKLAQAKVERRLILLCMKGDHRLYDLHFYFLFYASMRDMSTVARNRTISHNTNIVFSLGGHRLEGSPIWLKSVHTLFFLHIQRSSHEVGFGKPGICRYGLAEQLTSR